MKKEIFGKYTEAELFGELINYCGMDPLERLMYKKRLKMKGDETFLMIEIENIDKYL